MTKPHCVELQDLCQPRPWQTKLGRYTSPLFLASTLRSAFRTIYLLSGLLSRFANTTLTADEEKIFDQDLLLSRFRLT
jgi:hypothetical protein